MRTSLGVIGLGVIGLGIMGGALATAQAIAASGTERRVAIGPVAHAVLTVRFANVQRPSRRQCGEPQ